MFLKSSKHVDSGLPLYIRVLELQVHVAPGAYPPSPSVQEDFQIMGCSHEPLQDTKFNTMRILDCPCHVSPFKLLKMSA